MCASRKDGEEPDDRRRQNSQNAWISYEVKS